MNKQEALEQLKGILQCDAAKKALDVLEAADDMQSVLCEEEDIYVDELIVNNIEENSRYELYRTWSDGVPELIDSYGSISDAFEYAKNMTNTIGDSVFHALVLDTKTGKTKEKSFAEQRCAFCPEVINIDWALEIHHYHEYEWRVQHISEWYDSNDFTKNEIIDIVIESLESGINDFDGEGVFVFVDKSTKKVLWQSHEGFDIKF